MLLKPKWGNSMKHTPLGGLLAIMYSVVGLCLADVAHLIDFKGLLDTAIKSAAWVLVGWLLQQGLKRLSKDKGKKDVE